MLGPASSLLRRQCARSTTTLRAGAAFLRRPSVPTSIARQSRSLHSVPELQNQEAYRTNGLSPLFSPQGFEVAWVQYQKQLVDGLNEMVGGTQIENVPALDTAVMTAKRPELAQTFNYASQAHNNHFFFDGLTEHQTLPSEDLLSRFILPTFGTLDNLKQELIATGMAMFGSGWVWLVLDQQRKMRILATYNAGTPYGEAYRRQEIDTNTGSSLSSSPMSQDVRGKGAPWPLPLLNVSTWPQTWMADYGLEGKQQYLENWWHAIDWSVVMQRLPQSTIGQGSRPIAFN